MEQAKEIKDKEIKNFGKGNMNNIKPNKQCGYIEMQVDFF